MALNQDFLYREWQYPRIGSFLPILLFVPAVWIVAAPFNTNIGFLIGIVLAILSSVLKLATSRIITLTNDSLILGDAKIPRQAIGEITKIAKEDQFAARGSNLDARAFVFMKYGLPGLIRIEIEDPKDPTPYLLVSTRNADALMSALKSS